MLAQITTNGIQALKLKRPRTEPSARIGVIAAKTNWKYASVDCGKTIFPAGPRFGMARLPTSGRGS